MGDIVYSLANIDMVNEMIKNNTAQMRCYPVKEKIDYEIVPTSHLFEDAILGRMSPIYMSGNDIISKIVGEPCLGYSGDGGVTWNRIENNYFGTVIWAAITNYRNQKAMVVADMKDGEYRLSYSTNFENDSPENWSVKAILPSGQFSHSYGRSIRGNVVCATSYGTYDATNPPRHLCISKDGGMNFDIIEVEKIANMPAPNDFHLHDVEYDPWTGRIWISNGDRANTGLRYSDDFGVTWNLVDNLGGFSAGQPTNIIALPDRVLFGSDGIPNGFYVYIKKTNEKRAVVTKEDIKHLYSPDKISEINSVVNVANVSNNDMDYNLSKFPYNLYTFFTGSDGTNSYPARVLLTGDGNRFYEVWSSDDMIGEYVGTKPHKLYGPYIDGVTGVEQVILSVSHPTKGSFYIRLPILEWVTME